MTEARRHDDEAGGVPAAQRAAVLIGAHDIRIEERAVPTPAADEVLVRVTAVGVCGSDVHFAHEGRLGDWVVDEPLVLGHESGGVIVGVGAGVDPARIGRRVSVEPQHPDTTSAETLRGAYNLDPGMRFYAVPGTDGAFQQYVTIQSHFAFDVPDSVSDAAAALMEPLSVAIAAARKAHLSPGDRVLISGAGPIGIVCTQVARAFGATEITVTDVAAERLEAARSFGAHRTIDPTSEDVAATLGRVDAYIDASGAASAILSGIRQVRPGGRVVLVGMGVDELTLPITFLQNNEIELTGVFRYAGTWPTAISLVVDGRVDLDGMVTGVFPLDRVADALDSTADPTTIKSIVDPTL
ncbi:MAG: NAD(P)-dependent alcohol dehydrogenase [Microbacterium sp.]